MKNNIKAPPTYSFIILALLLLASPFTVSASTSRLSCELEVSVADQEVKSKKNQDILVVAGQEIEISWDSNKAKKAVDGEGERIERSGTATATPLESTTYRYVFSSGSAKKVCEVDVVVVSGSFATSTLTSTSLTPTIKGVAEGTKKVQLKIYKDESKKVLYTSRTISVKKGAWSSKVTKKLKDGTYTIELLGDKKLANNVIATSSLTIDKNGTTVKSTPKSSTIFAIEPVPLLTGGKTMGGATIPISYVQVINIGSAQGNVEHFKIKQNGSASTDTILGFTVSNEQGILATHMSVTFKDGIATIPVVIPLASKAMQLITLKAILAPVVMTQFGKQLMLDIVSVGTNAKVYTGFPIRGTTWTFGF